MPESKITEDQVVLRIMDQLELQGKTGKELEKALNLSNGTFTKWKYQNGKSYNKRIDDIAQYLGVKVSYLLDGTDDYVNSETLTGTEIKIIKLFRTMGDEQRKSFLKLGEFLMMSTKYERMDAIVSNE